MTATKIQPGDDTHLTLLMAPHSLNFVTGADRAALLAYGRDVFAAGQAVAAPAAVAPFGYVNTYTGQFFFDVDPCRKNNEGHWRTVYLQPAAVAPEHPPMPETWAVVASIEGQDVVCISSNALSGKGELTESEEQAVIGMAQHLLAFVGYGLPPCDFDPGDEPAPAPALEAPAAPHQEGDVFRALIEFLLIAEEPLSFLRRWNEGSFDICRREWPEAPDALYPLAAAPQAPAAPSAYSRSQHDADSRELRSLCIARDAARRERDLARVEIAGLQASTGHLSALVDGQHELLEKSKATMTALHGSASPIDESGGDFDARIPASAFARFVDAHAELLHAMAQSPAAAPAAPAVDDELLELAQAIVKFNREHGSVLAVHIDNLADLVDERAAQAKEGGA